jgi:hypothetical protein
MYKVTCSGCGNEISFQGTARDSVDGYSICPKCLSTISIVNGQKITEEQWNNFLPEQRAAIESFKSFFSENSLKERTETLSKSVMRYHQLFNEYFEAAPLQKLIENLVIFYLKNEHLMVEAEKNTLTNAIAGLEVLRTMQEAIGQIKN